MHETKIGRRNFSSKRRRLRKSKVSRRQTVFEKNTIKIGQLSLMTLVPEVTLRFYEAEKLITPLKNPDRKTRHRRYDQSAIVEVEFIKLCRSAGFSLPEIRSMLKLFRGFKPPAKLLMKSVHRTIESIRNKVKTLQEVERVLLLRMQSPQGDIEELINQGEGFWRLKGFAESKKNKK